MWPVAAFSEKLLETLGVRFVGPISILRNWTFCLFYVMAELWGSVVVSLLFWGFANQVLIHATARFSRCHHSHFLLMLRSGSCDKPAAAPSAP